MQVNRLIRQYNRIVDSREEPSGERWLPIPGYERLYEVSDHSRVRSLPRLTEHAGVRGGRILRQTATGRYRRASLSRGGEARLHQVHSLVMLAFCGPCPPGMEVLHGPAGKDDNSLVNLAYGTHKQNIDDHLRDGTARKGERHGRAKLTERDVREIRARARTGAVHRVLAAEFGVARSTIAAVVCNQNWREVA